LRTGTWNLVLLSLVSTALGCARVEIVSSRIADATPEHVVVELVTTKDLRQFDKSYFADHVYLSYEPSGTQISTEFEKPGRAGTFPFASDKPEFIECGASRHCSKWSIPLEYSTNISLYTYKYKLREGDTLELKIGGGSMAGGRLTSNVVLLKVPPL
jgi:hypothetical protein